MRDALHRRGEVVVVFYRIDDRMMSVEFRPTGDTYQLSTPRQLFVRAYAYGAGVTIANYDVSIDGQRIHTSNAGGPCGKPAWIIGADGCDAESAT